MADEVKLPTKEEIAKLPRWARVAFAARCARRVLPLYKHHWPDAPEEYVADIVNAVEIAEQSAAAGYADTRAAARAAADAARAASVAADFANADPAAYTAAHTASDAAADAAADAATARGAATDTAAWLAGKPIIVRDFQTLLARVNAENWTDNTPVPPKVFGPLWPDGPPEGWPIQSDAPHVDPAAEYSPATQDEDFKLIIRAVAKPGVSAETVREHIVKLFEALNEYSLEKYGRRLTADRFRRLVFVSTGARV